MDMYILVVAEELAMEKKSKKKKTSFANETNQLPAGSKRKAKKKLSLSKGSFNFFLLFLLKYYF